MRAFYVLLGALFTVATAWSLGTVLIRRLGLKLYRTEDRLFAFLTGSASLSAMVFVLCALKLAHNGVFVILGFAILGYGFRYGALRPAGDRFEPLPRLARWLLIVVFGTFSALYVVNAMAPEMSPDGMTYHLGIVEKYHDAHGFYRITTDMYANLPEGIELLFLFAFAIGRHSAAAVVHLSFLVCLALMVLSYGRRIGRPLVGAAAAIFVYASPLIGLDSTIAYNDVALAAVLFGVFYMLQIWDVYRASRILAPAGMVAGFAYAVKYTGAPAVLYAAGFVAWKLVRARKPVVRPVFTVAICAMAFVLPWMVKNWIEVANPVSPFANRMFPNPYVHIWFEEDYRKFFRTYDLTSLWQIPWDVTVRGEHLVGFLGPLFLLTPLALLALRFREGRQLLLAAAIFFLPYFSNIGTRFLIPVIPFVALALPLALAGTGRLLLILAAAHAIASWPQVAPLYCAPGAWRLATFPVRAALRIQPEDSYLKQDQGYRTARMVDQIVPRGARILAFAVPAQAYMSRDVMISYEGAFNELLQDILWTPAFAYMQPLRIVKFQFDRREVKAMRVVQTARVPDQQWSVTELRIFNHGQELPRAHEWRLTAQPNPWDVQLAFDNSPVTRWRSWQHADAGMYMQVQFGRATAVDSVILESSADASNTKVRIEGMLAEGKWVAFSDRAEVTSLSPRVSLRRAATSELKFRGVRYLLVDGDAIKSDDYRLHGELWGLRPVGESGGTRLYLIE